jgi:hypothetical protein
VTVDEDRLIEQPPGALEIGIVGAPTENGQEQDAEEQGPTERASHAILALMKRSGRL